MTEVTLEVYFENFYCPMTGESILAPLQFNPSPETVFLFLHPFRSFEYLREDLKEAYADLYNNEAQHGALYLS